MSRARTTVSHSVDYTKSSDVCLATFSLNWIAVEKARVVVCRCSHIHSVVAQCSIVHYNIAIDYYSPETSSANPMMWPWSCREMLSFPLWYNIDNKSKSNPNQTPTSLKLHELPPSHSHLNPFPHHNAWATNRSILPEIAIGHWTIQIRGKQSSWAITTQIYMETRVFICRSTQEFASSTSFTIPSIATITKVKHQRCANGAASTRHHIRVLGTSLIGVESTWSPDYRRKWRQSQYGRVREDKHTFPQGQRQQWWAILHVCTRDEWKQHRMWRRRSRCRRSRSYVATLLCPVFSLVFHCSRIQEPSHFSYTIDCCWWTF